MVLNIATLSHNFLDGFHPTIIQTRLAPHALGYPIVQPLLRLVFKPVHSRVHFCILVYICV